MTNEVKCKDCIHSYINLEKHLDMEGVKHQPTLECKLGNQIQLGGIPLNSKCFEPK